MKKLDATYDKLMQRISDLEGQLKNCQDNSKDSKFYLQAFDRANVGISFIDLQGNIIKVNPEMAHIVGYSLAELESRNIKDVIHADFLEDFNTKIRQAINGEFESQVKERQYLQKNGETITCSIKSNLVCDAEGKPAYFVTYLKDITEEKKAKEELQKKEAHLRSIFEAMSEGFSIQDVICDEDGNPCDLRFVDANPAFEEQTGLKNKDTLGHTLLELFPDSEKYWIERYGKVGLTGEPTNFEAEFGPLNIHYQCNAFQTKQGQFGTMFTDINDRKIAEIQLKEKNKKIEIQNEELSLAIKELQLAKERAEESDRLKTAFLNNMSHEIRTPLNGIIGFSEMIVELEESSELSKDYGHVIVESSYQLLNIVNDVLDIARIEAGLVQLNEVPTNLANVCIELHDTFKEEASKKNIKFELVKSPTLPSHEIIVDRVKLMQIMNNLLNNAIKFTEKGTIKIGCEKKNDKIEFAISDTGIGMKKELHEIIFERFRQAEVTTTRNYGGTGLGLSICKELIKKMKGEIWLKSELGIGTTFFFSLPYKITPQEELVVIKQRSSKVTDYSNLTILVAEDEEVNFLYISLVLEKANIIRAKNGKEAIELATNNPQIDIILMDIKMPVLDGYEATKKIRAINSSVPIIAVTAHAFADDQKRALEAGCNNYLAKPVKKEKLLNAINELVYSY